MICTNETLGNVNLVALTTFSLTGYLFREEIAPRESMVETRHALTRQKRSLLHELRSEIRAPTDRLAVNLFLFRAFSIRSPDETPHEAQRGRPAALQP